MKLFVAALALSALVAQSTPSQVRIWKAEDDIKARGEALSKKLDANKVASDIIATDGNRTFMVAHREGSGLAEWHEKQADVMTISTGRGDDGLRRHNRRRKDHRAGGKARAVKSKGAPK